MDFEDVLYAMGIAVTIIVYLARRFIWEPYVSEPQEKKPNWWVITIILVAFFLFSFI